MTERLYYESAYIKEFDAEVISCEKKNDIYLIELDRTAFYPEGGGQPADTGVLYEIRSEEENREAKTIPCAAGSALTASRKLQYNEENASAAQENGALLSVQVTDVHEYEGHLYHYCDRAVKAGTRLHGRINWERRFDHMQQHSGEHIVSGMICDTFACDNVGFHMGQELVTIDYNTDISMEQLKLIEERANRYIWENHRFTAHWYEGNELKDIEYRSKKEISGAVRITSFPEADTCACCGTHTAESAEIGLVKLISCRKFTRGTRIELLCGKRAFDYLSLNYEQNSEIAVAMASSADKTAVIYRKQTAELAETKLRASEMEKKYCQAAADSYKSAGNVLVFEDKLSADGVRLLCTLISRICGGACAVFSGSGNEMKYAVGCAGGDLREFVKQMNTALNGRGGGKPDFVQGNAAAGRAEIRDFFREIGWNE